MSDEQSVGARRRWHDLLLRLAGWLPDRELAEARALLAANRLDDVAQVIATCIGTGLVPYSPQDGERLRELLAAHTDDLSVVDAGVRQEMEQPPCAFASVPPWSIGPSMLDDVDLAAVTAAASSGVTRLWRVWRYPATSLQSVRRIYLAQTSADVDPVEVAGRLQDELVRAGEQAPQVEAYVVGNALPEYHRSALDEAEAIWPPED